MAKIVGFVEAPTLGLDLPLDLRGTAFQQRVWRALSEIPVGTTVSYADIARSIGQPKAVRAVAQACGANRSEEHTSELQSLMRISYAVFCLKQKKKKSNISIINNIRYTKIHN